MADTETCKPKKSTCLGDVAPTIYPKGSFVKMVVECKEKDFR